MKRKGKRKENGRENENVGRKEKKIKGGKDGKKKGYKKRNEGRQE